MSNRNRKNKSIPDGWKDYFPINETIEDIKIVPFKVPLPVRKFEDSYMSQYRWTPVDVLNKVPDLGLVIDLTFKQPAYYNPLEFLENGVNYEKIGCPGHVIPPEDTFRKFCDTIDDFLRVHPNMIVGVHCTHGVNRTGYMICRYMIEKHGYMPENALDVFAVKRGYKIERDNYIEGLHKSEMNNFQL